MVEKYLKVASAPRNEKHTHPHYSRSVIINDEVVSLDTYEDTPYDREPEVESPTITQQIKAGVRLQPMGSKPSETMLQDAQIGEQFIRQFNALGRQLPDNPQAVDNSPAAEQPSVVDDADKA